MHDVDIKSDLKIYIIFEMTCNPRMTLIYGYLKATHVWGPHHVK